MRVIPDPHLAPSTPCISSSIPSSAFSFLDGASLPATLIERAAALGYPALALLDRDGVYGAPQFYRAAKAAGIKAIVGAELTIGQGSSAQRLVPASWCLPVLVASAEGYRNLCRVITRAKLRAPKGESHLTLEDFAGQTAGLIALVGRQALRAERHGVGGLDRPAGRRVRPAATSGSNCSGTSGATSRANLQSLLDLGRGVPRAGDGVERRAVRDAGGAAALRRVHLPPAQDDAGRRRAGG